MTIVDESVYACRISSQAYSETKTDWRRATSLGLKLKHQIIELPADVSTRCVQLVSMLGLRFGAIDLIESDTDYTFLEINPNGQWAWVEELTGASISSAIARALNGA